MHEKYRINKAGRSLIYSSLARRVSGRSRDQKMRRFREILGKVGAQDILDVGSGVEWSCAQNTLHEFFSSGELPIRRLVGIGLEDLVPLRFKYVRVGFVQGDALHLPFGDKAFDLAYSNAVIEHVFPVSARKHIVSEMLRVARGVFITTPNKWFPVEVHSRLPIIHWLPSKVHNLVLKWFDLECFSRGIYFDPMSIQDVRACFPSTTRPTIELGMFGMTIVAHYMEG